MRAVFHGQRVTLLDGPDLAPGPRMEKEPQFSAHSARNTALRTTGLWLSCLHLRGEVLRLGIEAWLFQALFNVQVWHSATLLPSVGAC